MRFALALLWLSAVALRAADREERTWIELPSLVGSEIRFATAMGTTIRGRLTAVESDALVVQIKSTSDKVGYPKGRCVIPRAEVRVFEVRSRTSRYRVIGTVTGAALGLGLGGLAAIHTDSGAAAIASFAAITGGVTPAGYFLGVAADNHWTTIVIRP